MDKASAVAPPSDSRLAPLFAEADLADAFAISLPPEASGDVVALARAVLTHPPRWVAPFMRTRDAIMGAFGIKTSEKIRAMSAGRGKGVIGSFPIHNIGATEVVMGEDDRHLDFRTSMMIRQAAGSRELVWITSVRCHNALGRVYLSVIKPFHRLIVPAFLTGAARRGWPTDDASTSGTVAADEPQPRPA